MTNGKEETSPAQRRWAEALVNQGEDRREHLLEVADELREEMENQSVLVRDLILAQPPVQLLGYLLAQLHMRFFATLEEKDEEAN